MSGLDGLVTIVTGAASGLGEATARRFAASGAHVILSDIAADRGCAIADEIGQRFVPCDVTDEDQVAALVQAAVDAHGRLDVMIANAGLLGAVGSVAEIEGAAFRRTIEVLLTSVFYSIKHAARVMIPQGAGCILTTSSAAGIAALGPLAYTAAKHGVVGLTKSAASELARHGIRVNSVAPGTVPSGLTNAVYGSADGVRAKNERANPLRRGVEADEIAGAFAYLAGPDGRNITGHVLAVDAGLTACPAATDYASKDATYVDAS
ncbi:SDR family oxidoreductase [Sphingomonas sp. 1P06PA]|uniref:SDR family NAD(P)-dependent oxidoreductase n=1 Tax=Sphingomonas sp. 1P06PA TaxID=554121 RepID=UPI0039A60D32